MFTSPQFLASLTTGAVCPHVLAGVRTYLPFTISDFVVEILSPFDDGTGHCFIISACISTTHPGITSSSKVVMTKRIIECLAAPQIVFVI